LLTAGRKGHQEQRDRGVDRFLRRKILAADQAKKVKNLALLKNRVNQRGKNAALRKYEKTAN
jgi:hypothetical protein